MSPRDDLSREVEKVVNADNCTGCGACALLSDRISIQFSSAGYLRPVVASGLYDSEVAKRFRDVCPGVGIVAQRGNLPSHHPIFGAYTSSWSAWASDPALRASGSSAGVISSILDRVVRQTGIATAVAQGSTNATRTVPVTIQTRAEVLASAGSRYAPVAACASATKLTSDDVFVGKPCEAAAYRAVADGDLENAPLIVSFFCAGTPSQHATEKIISDRLGLDPTAVTELEYRGGGWPGSFIARTAEAEAQLSYKESWGGVLGKSLQWRCKVCPDGTGQQADIVIGDYWEADSKGFPILEARPNSRSVVICRTSRGHRAFLQAIADGDIVASELDLDPVVAVQPLQEDRRVTMLGRLVGTRLAGRRVPRFVGFDTWKLFLRHPMRNFRAGMGAFLRVRGWRA